MRAALWISLAALLSGALLVLCLPLGEQAYLAWFALVPLLVATRGRGFLVAFGAGLGSLLFAAWLSSSGALYQVHDGVKNDAWLYTGFGIFGFSLSLTFGVWGEPIKLRPKPWWFAALATLLESVLLWKLPAHLALSQYRNALMVQAASIGGVWIVSFAIWLTNFAIAAAFDPEVAPKERPRRLLIALCFPLAAILFGRVWLPTEGSRETVAALQFSQCDEATMRTAQHRAAQAGASLAVWPEFGGLEMAPGGDTRLLRQMGDPPFVTSFQDDLRPLPHNVAALFAAGEEKGSYAKRKLFGEESKMHTPGDRAAVVDAIGLNICFDSCFPSVIRDTARLGARLVALPTIDPPSTNGFIAAVHASYTPFRAAESGVAIVRADGNAYSMIVDPHGRIVAEAPPGDRVMVSAVAVGSHWTIAKWLGDWWLWTCGAFVVWPLAKRLFRRSRKLAGRSKDPVDLRTDAPV
jgi:apolipoprotein N-acyltransferase